MLNLLQADYGHNNNSENKDGGNTKGIKLPQGFFLKESRSMYKCTTYINSAYLLLKIVWPWKRSTRWSKSTYCMEKNIWSTCHPTSMSEWNASNRSVITSIQHSHFCQVLSLQYCTQTMMRMYKTMMPRVSRYLNFNEFKNLLLILFINFNPIVTLTSW